MITQEKIKELAKQAGFERLGVYAQFGNDWVGFTKDLETFAKLVAEKERRACARICAEVGMWDLVHEIEGRGQE